jgi:hypothetical protein
MSRGHLFKWRRKATRLRRLSLAQGVVVILGLLVVAGSPGALAASTIVLDGQFGDWSGQAFLSDPQRDRPQTSYKCDIRYFYWATNPGDSTLYFMVERWPKNSGAITQTVTYMVHMSLDGDSVYTGVNDYVVVCFYDPAATGANAEVGIRRGSDPPDTYLVTYSGRWGEDATSGLRVEWKAPFADIGLATGQPMRLYLQASTKDAGASDPHDDFCPDTGAIDWAPVPTLGLVGTVVLLVVGLSLACAAWRARGLRPPALPGAFRRGGRA